MSFSRISRRARSVPQSWAAVSQTSRSIRVIRPFFTSGSAHGGVFKTGDNGVSFDPIFDKERIPLDRGRCDCAVGFRCGLGRHRRSERPQFFRMGQRRLSLHRWRRAHGRTSGLKESRAIGRIIVHPRRPEVAYVAALGHLWADGGERGLFKTTDGGKTWKLVLQATRA